MVRIISDTSTLYSRAQAREAGFAVSALTVTIAGKTYVEFDEITAPQFVDIINQGHMPTSSQPAVGMVAELYEEFPHDELINITMADGLSGTYGGAQAAADLCANPDRITVVNSTTLCGPHRYMVERAVEWAAAGESKQQILDKLQVLIANQKSYLLPDDFGYLRRGGRLSPLVAFVGQAGGLVPIMTQSDDGKQLTLAGIRRGFPAAVKKVVESLVSQGVGPGYKVFVSFAGARSKAELAQKTLMDALPGTSVEIYDLSPAFITQGGPSCVAVQWIKEL